MARRQVVEVQCDRCGKTETRVPSEGDEDNKVEMFARFHKQEVTYGDLCLRCRNACERYFNNIVKKTEDKPEEEQKKTGLLGLGGRK